jgi:hypothetical protein
MTLREFSALGDLVQVNILRLYLRFLLPWDTYKRGIYRGTDIILYERLLHIILTISWFQILQLIAFESDNFYK